ncbi:MAG TPA: efflux RND transporter periplasmic adaptor subunit, partial [bacterium]
QQIDAQQALVQQLEGAIVSDKAMVDSARLMVEFTHITAPIAGRTGLRQVDVGNIVHAADPGGIVVITQTQPISAVFSVPAEQLGIILPGYNNGAKLPVETFDRDGKTKLANGVLASVDNQIDTTSGTVKLKAQFTNEDNKLFPNQFVNVRLTVTKLPDKTLIPTAAVQRGTPGTYVYMVTDDNTAMLRKVTLGLTYNGWVAIEDGLKPDDKVVIDGADDLRDGTKVEIIPLRPGAVAPSGDAGGGQGARAGGAPTVSGPSAGAPKADSPAGAPNPGAYRKKE